LVVVVVGAAVVGSRLGGAVAAVSSTIAFDLFFTQPYGSLTIHGRDDIETTFLLLVVGVVVGELVVRTRRSRVAEVAKQHELDRMQRLAELAAGGEPPGRLIQAVQRELIDLLHLENCYFERPPFGGSFPMIGHGRVLIEDGALATLSPPNTVELPVWGDGRQVGRFVLELPYDSIGLLIPTEDRATAVALADKLGSLLVNGAG
jgi:two-component system sensor histidine kinase KdpD